MRAMLSAWGLVFPTENLMPQSLFPRRYCIDDEGRRVVIGLTLEQTREFERLEELRPLADVQAGMSLTTNAAHPIDARWSELYRLHQEAWEVWRTNGSDGGL